MKKGSQQTVLDCGTLCLLDNNRELNHQTFSRATASGSQIYQPRPQGFSLKKWVGREKALASAGSVSSLNIHVNGNV